MSGVQKVIVTHIGALRRKHGLAGTRRIVTALGRLVRADAGRGVGTRWIALDRKADMVGIGRSVGRAVDRRQTKRAIDDVWTRFQPHYLMLLGAPDVLPHQRLKNPLFDPDIDPDRWVESDLPYACDAAYGTDIGGFLGPTRVVGRLADVQGRGDTDHLLRVLDAAAMWKARPRRSYGGLFGISAEAWKGSTRSSARKLFGSSKGVRVSPGAGPRWTKAALRPRIHFINCHGETLDPAFYGESEADMYDQPDAHLSAHLAGRVREATVVAAECCFGAELFEPVGDGPMGICQAYLDQGAYGFFGSTTIAYGPSSGTGLADIMCIDFVRGLLEGASLGRAVLAARQNYIAAGGHMGPHDLKTLAQFLLLGDPSIHPVRPAVARNAGETRADAPQSAAKRSLRRKRLAGRGASIQRSTASVATRPDARLSGGLRDQIVHSCKGFDPKTSLSFRLHAACAPETSAVARRPAAAETVFHILADTPEPCASGVGRSRARVVPRRLVVATEIDGRLDHTLELFRH